MTTPPDHEAVMAALAASPDRAVRVGGYWAKRAARAQTNAWHRLQKCAFETLRIKLFAPTWAEDPSAALAGEAARLERLGRGGFHVPDVARVTPESLLLADAGREVHETMRHADAETRLALVRRCAGLLAKLHRDGLWHGRASLRDFVLQGDTLGFIDCEEDASRLGDWARPRDLLLFLQSIARFSGDGALVKEALAAYGDLAVKAQLAKTLRWISPAIRALSPFRQSLGRDLKQMLIVCEALA
ncbi:MAG: hypothetical protein J0L97_08940 [Alphaproteobacteria bacterium]|nr:hypothetical protein [Alphaproteobacteria bacterium]